MLMVCPCLSQLALHVVDREIALPHGDGQVAHRIPGRSVAGTGSCHREEVGPFGWVMAELVAKGTKGTGRVAEAACDFGGGEAAR